MKEKENNWLVVISVFVFVLSLGAAIFTFLTTPEGYSVITGFASTSANAYINLSVERALALNFTVYNLSLGSGRVDNPYNATINTATCTIVGGNWSNKSPAMGMGVGSPGACGFRLENLGNSPLYNLSFKASYGAQQWLGGTNPVLRLNVTSNKTAGGTTPACRNLTDGSINSIRMQSGYQVGSWFDVNTTEFIACDIFNYTNDADVVRVDVLLVIPSDNQINGATGNIITAIGYA